MVFIDDCYSCLIRCSFWRCVPQRAAIYHKFGHTRVDSPTPLRERPTEWPSIGNPPATLPVGGPLTHLNQGPESWHGGGDVMRNSPRLRLCERCWRPIAVTATSHVTRYFDSTGPIPRILLAFRHLHTDRDCTGSQLRSDASGPGETDEAG